MKIYTIVEISVDPYDAVEHTVVVKTNMEDAKAALNQMHEAWKESKKQYDDEITEDWFTSNLDHDLEHEDYKLLHYIYDEGIERLFSIECHEVE